MSETSAPMVDVNKYFTQEEVKRIIMAGRTHRDKLLIMTLAYTGRRVSEIVRELTPYDIDEEKNLINYTILKRKRPTKSLLPANPYLVEKLMQWVRVRGIEEHTPIFNISRQRADVIIKDAAKKVGIRNAHAHMFRHSFAIQSSQKLKSPADLVQLKDLLAHGRIDTTMFYLKFNPKEKRQLVKDLWD